MPEFPTITVVIPALNEQQHIDACLDSLHSQSYPSDRYSVVVVDNGSTDKTPEMVQAKGVRLLHEPRKSAFWARNLAIENSESDWLAFTDADCLADRDWLTNLVRCASGRDAMLVGGLISYDMVFDTLGNRLLMETHQPDQLRRTIEDHHSVASGNMFVRRDAFEMHGLFNVIAWGSDIDFSKRIAEQNHVVAFAEDAMVTHQCDLSNWEYWRRSFETRYGQVLLFDQRQGWLAAARNFVSIPWRPGFRGGVNRYSTEEIKKAPAISDWLYRWVNRWMEFFGEQMALIKKTK